MSAWVAAELSCPVGSWRRGGKAEVLRVLSVGRGQVPAPPTQHPLAGAMGLCRLFSTWSLSSLPADSQLRGFFKKYLLGH